MDIVSEKTDWNAICRIAKHLQYRPIRPTGKNVEGILSKLAVSKQVGLVEVRGLQVVHGPYFENHLISLTLLYKA